MSFSFHKHSTFFILKSGDDTLKAHQSENVHLLLLIVWRFLLAMIFLALKSIKSLSCLITKYLVPPFLQVWAYLLLTGGPGTQEQLRWIKPLKKNHLALSLVFSHGHYRYFGNGAALEWLFLQYILSTFMYLWFRDLLSPVLHHCISA